jgi:phage shock protein A
MSAEFQSIDEAITASYQSASQVETQARQLEARIAKIDGTKHLLPARRYGQPVDMAKIRSNLTLTSLIAQDSAELAHFCGIDPGIRHRIDEEKEARALAAQALQMRTEALRQQNQQRQQQVQQRSQLSPWQRDYRSV